MPEKEALHKKCKAATPSSTGFRELTLHVPLFEQQYIHVLYPAPTHSTRPPLLLPPTGKQALQTKLEQLCGSPGRRKMLFPVEKQRYPHNGAVCGMLFWSLEDGIKYGPYN